MCLLYNTADSSKKYMNLSDIVRNFFFTNTMLYFGKRKMFATIGHRFKYVFSHLIVMLKGASQ